MKLVFNKCSTAVVMSTDSEGLGAAFEADVFRTSLSQVVYHISTYTLFPEVLASVMILGRNSLLKFV